MTRSNTGFLRPDRTAQQKESALVQLLYFCTPERLAGFTDDSLAASYGVGLERVRTLLAEARMRRGV